MLVCSPKQVKPKRPLGFQLHKRQAIVFFCEECVCLLCVNITGRRSGLGENLLFAFDAGGRRRTEQKSVGRQLRGFSG